MKKYDIEHIPVMDGEGLIDSISENGLFKKMIDNPEIKTSAVKEVMDAAFPLV